MSPDDLQQYDFDPVLSGTFADERDEPPQPVAFPTSGEAEQPPAEPAEASS